MTATYKEYREEMQAFFKKHGEWTVETSPLDEYNRYTKTYSFEDGAQWFEVMGDCWEEAEAEVKGMKMTVNVHLYKTEYWSTEAGSKYMYERY